MPPLAADRARETGNEFGLPRRVEPVEVIVGRGQKSKPQLVRGQGREGLGQECHRACDHRRSKGCARCRIIAVGCDLRGADPCTFGGHAPCSGLQAGTRDAPRGDDVIADQIGFAIDHRDPSGGKLRLQQRQSRHQPRLCIRGSIGGREDDHALARIAAQRGQIGLPIRVTQDPVVADSADRGVDKTPRVVLRHGAERFGLARRIGEGRETVKRAKRQISAGRHADHGGRAARGDRGDHRAMRLQCQPRLQGQGLVGKHLVIGPETVIDDGQDRSGAGQPGGMGIMDPGTQKRKCLAQRFGLRIAQAVAIGVEKPAQGLLQVARIVLDKRARGIFECIEALDEKHAQKRGEIRCGIGAVGRIPIATAATGQHGDTGKQGNAHGPLPNISARACAHCPVGLDHDGKTARNPSDTWAARGPRVTRLCRDQAKFQRFDESHGTRRDVAILTPASGDSR